MDATYTSDKDHDRAGPKLGEKAREVGKQVQNSLEPNMHLEPLQGTWEAMEKIPVGTYYFAVLGSILLSLGFYASGKKDTGQFVAHWAPTFALLGLMNKLLRPSNR